MNRSSRFQAREDIYILLSFLHQCRRHLEDRRDWKELSSTYTNSCVLFLLVWPRGNLLMLQWVATFTICAWCVWWSEQYVWNAVRHAQVFYEAINWSGIRGSHLLRHWCLRSAVFWDTYRTQICTDHQLWLWFRRCHTRPEWDLFWSLCLVRHQESALRSRHPIRVGALLH